MSERKRFMAVLAIVGMLLVIHAAAAPDAAQAARQAELASTLIQGTDQERQIALAQILAVPPQERSAVLIDAAVQEALRYRVVLDHRGTRYEAGEQLEPLPETDYLPRLLRVLADTHDPRVIEPLCRFIDLGGTSMVGDALARFGDRAVWCVAVVASDRSARSDRASGALHVLARMLYLADPQVSPSTRVRMRQIATDRLMTAGAGAAVSTIYSAAELALGLGNGALVARVRELSVDPAAITALGLQDQAHVAILQGLLQKLISPTKT